MRRAGMSESDCSLSSQPSFAGPGNDNCDEIQSAVGLSPEQGRMLTCFAIDSITQLLDYLDTCSFSSEVLHVEDSEARSKMFEAITLGVGKLS